LKKKILFSGFLSFIAMILGLPRNALNIINSGKRLLKRP